MRKGLVTLSLLCCLAPWGWGQPAPVGAESTLAERLGYSPQERFLIIHGDDLGLAHSVNRASFEALRKGAINSASIMVPCPWLQEVADFAKSDPDFDLGLHLTLNAEWELIKWGPVASRDRVASLVDPLGYFYAGVQETIDRAQAQEVEVEMRAQIERATGMGIRPTHLDTHMGTLFRTPQLLAVLLKLGREYRLPVLGPRRMLAMAPYARDLIQPSDPLIEDVKMMIPGVPEDQWTQAYSRMIEQMRPGVTQLIVHLAYDDEEMRGVAHQHPDYGARWRQLDYETVTSPEFARTLQLNGVKLITWREIGRLLQ